MQNKGNIQNSKHTQSNERIIIFNCQIIINYLIYNYNIINNY